jgi:hypothetical protein
MQTFQDFAAQNLQGFGFSIQPSDIPDWDTVHRVVQGVSDWRHSLDECTQTIIYNSDLADGLWQVGMLSDWPALYSLLKGNLMGDFFHTFDDVIAALNRAHHQVDEQPSDPVSNVNDVVGAGDSGSQ